MKKSNRMESLISTMGTKPKDLCEKMNLQTDAIIINQTDRVGYTELIHKNNNIREYSFMERGVGRSRNAALMRAKGDICLMADDDMVYVNDYPHLVEEAYKRHPDADMIIFNVRIHTKDATIEKVKKSGKVNFFNSLKYGTVTFTFKKESIYKKTIFFSLLFGGGAKYSNGEDSIFLWDCLKKGLKVYAVEDTIADVYNEESSWFTGYNEKFFFDRGALFEALSPRNSRWLIYQYALRKNRQYQDDMPMNESIRLMQKGAHEFRRTH